VNKTEASAAQLANCILLDAYSRITAVPAARAQIKTAYLTSWYNSIFDYKLRAD